MAVRTSEGAGWSSQPGRGSAPAPMQHLCPWPSGILGMACPDSRPLEGGRELQCGGAPAGEKDSRGEPALETHEFRGSEGCGLPLAPASWGQHGSPGLLALGDLGEIPQSRPVMGSVGLCLGSR